MKKAMTAGAVLLLTTSIGHAGGLDRSGQPVGIIFEEGNVVQLSFGLVAPDVTGEANGFMLGGYGSGNMAESYTQFSGGIKMDFNDQTSFAVIFDQPFGANVNYADIEFDGGGGYYTGMATAEARSSAVTALARYNVSDAVSVHGGLRVQTIGFDIAKPPLENYAIEGENSTAVGFVVGAAYEMPEIALRVAVTYNSKVTHDIEATESCTSTDAQTDVLCANDITDTTSVDTPESFNIDFQSGVAADTLVFGSIRYAKWTQFDFKPPMHDVLSGSLQSYDEDSVAYNIGVGRRINDQFSAALSVGYEAAQGGFAGDLAPTDGNLSIGLGGTYTMGDTKFTAGARYIMLGDADTEHPLIDDAVGSEFRDNTAVAFGLQVTQSF